MKKFLHILIVSILFFTLLLSSCTSNTSSSQANISATDLLTSSTILRVSEPIISTFADQENSKSFVWLAASAAAYKVSVVSDGAGKLNVTAYYQDSTSTNFNKLKKVTTSKNVDYTTMAKYPALYVVQITKDANSGVKEFQVRVDMTEDPLMPPSIFSMIAHGNPNDTFSVFGSGFGSNQGSLMFGSVSSTKIVSWSPTLIIAQVPQGSGSLDVYVKTALGNKSNSIKFYYGPELADDINNQVSNWAESKIPEAEKRRDEAAERMWQAYLKAQASYNELKQTKGTEAFQDLDKAIVAVAWKIDGTAVNDIAKMLMQDAQNRGETGASLVAPFLVRYALAALKYYEIGQWAAMDAVLISRNIKAQWYQLAVLKPAVDDYNQAEEELTTLRNAVLLTSKTTSTKSTEPTMQTTKAFGKIAFYDSGPIYVMNADGSNQTLLTNNSGGDMDPDWSPDGTKIAFVSERYTAIYVINADGSNQICLANNFDNVRFPTWSPDGTKIAFTLLSDDGSSGDIYVMNADGSNQTRLTNSGVSGYTTWSPDGTKIAFVSDPDHDSLGSIYVMNADGSNQTRLTKNSSGDTLPAWSPNGTKIAFVSDLNSDPHSLSGGNIYVMNADGSNRTRITNNFGEDMDPDWSPDGTRITFSSGGDNGYQIYVMNANGTNQTRLTNISGYNLGPKWSPR